MTLAIPLSISFVHRLREHLAVEIGMEAFFPTIGDPRDITGFAFAGLRF